MYYDEKPKKSKGIKSYVIVAIVAALIGGILSPYIANSFIYGKILPSPYGGESKGNQGQNINIKTNDDVNAVSAVAEKAMGSVVGITTVQTEREFIWEREVEGVGSGFVVHEDGYIMTNSHVVGNGEAKKIDVLFENGDTKPASLLWNDSTLDMAIIKVEAKGLQVADLGDSDQLKVGELAVAIGNPLGLEFQRTVTSGVISGLDRSMKTSEKDSIDNLIQTDASINPGNSGGPLLNKNGEVIGINTVKIKSQVAEGLGFALPINMAKPIIDSVVKTGNFETVKLGIQPIEIDAYERTLGVELSVDKGLVVLEVGANSPAAKAGIQAMDILTKIDDLELETRNQLKKELYKYKVGDVIKLSYLRNGEEFVQEVKLTATN